MTPKPRWQARNEREQEQMVQWVHEHLDELVEAPIVPAASPGAESI